MAKVYSNIETLPFKIFRDCTVSGDLKKLIISGRVSNKKLEQAWKNIQDEYFDMMASPQSKRYLYVQAEIAVNVSRLKVVRVLCELLISEWNNESEGRKGIIKLLNEVSKTNFKFKKTEDIQRVLKRTSFLNLKIQMLKSELEELGKKMSETGEQPTFQYFTNILITLGDFSKYQISDEISTFEYCERLRRYNKFIKDASSSSNKRR